MPRGIPAILALALALAEGCSPVRSGGDGDGDGDGDTSRLADTDGDCISDEAEGRDLGVDTDRDGAPDYQDLDSDGDSIPDRVEALNAECDRSRAPADSDSDGTPNFQDLDSDANGIPDREEPTGDLDADGTPDFGDADDDGDFISDLEEIGPDSRDPSDADDDGVSDYRDTDSDDDTIRDYDEGSVDTDGDGMPDFVDRDADNDGIEDEEEAGDRDPMTRPRDTDADMVPDFKDEDSDNDGLTDAWERGRGTDPYDADTDGDGVTDMVEVGAGTDPTDAADDPRSRGHFVFLVPYMEAPYPPEDTLAFSTSLRLADVFMVLDLTASMSTELATVRSTLTGVVESVTCGPDEAPSETNPCIPDLWVGFGYFTDVADSHALTVERNLTGDFESVIDAIPTATGGGSAESQRRAAYCTVHGPGGTPCPPGPVSSNDEWPCPRSGIGFPCYRADAARLLILVTDEDMEQDPVPDFDTVADALLSAQITFIGINASTPPEPVVTADLLELVARTGSFDEHGDPLLFDGADSAVSDSLIEAIAAVARVPLDVTARAVGSREGGVDSGRFVERLETNEEGGAACEPWTDTRDDDHDGHDDTFVQIQPGSPVCWDIAVGMNDIVAPTAAPQMFTATIEVRGGAGGTLLDSRRVFFLVPSETYVRPPG